MNDEALWSAFQDRALTHTEWTHQAHLRVAWLHLARWVLDEAHLRMRVGIIRLNTAHGLEETAKRGYHETLTRVWFAIVAALRHTDAGRDSLDFITKHADRLDRSAPLRHYSHDRLFSSQARAIYVPPDLEPLP
jgi:hypothetical protein